MRIAVLIIGLLLGAIMFFQTFLGSMLSSVADDEAAGTAAAAGLIMALLWLVACGLVLPFPMVSVVLFALAASLGFANSADFPDLAWWGGVSLALAVMSLLGWRGKRKEKRESAEARLEQFNRDQRLESILQQQQSELRQLRPQPEPLTFPNFCPACKHRNEQSAKYCAECGTALTAS